MQAHTENSSFDLGALLHNLPRPLPLVDLDRVMAEERAGYRAHLESVTSLLHESEHERRLLHQQLKLLKELVAGQDVLVKTSRNKQTLDAKLAVTVALPTSTVKAEDADALGIPPVSLEYIKTVVVRYIETHDTSLLPVLREVLFSACLPTTSQAISRFLIDEYEDIFCWANSILYEISW